MEADQARRDRLTEPTRRAGVTERIDAETKADAPRLSKVPATNVARRGALARVMHPRGAPCHEWYVTGCWIIAVEANMSPNICMYVRTLGCVIKQLFFVI